MSMPIFALFDRTLREDSRRIPNLFDETGAGGGILLLLIFLQLIQFRFGAPGLEFLRGVIYVNYGFIPLAGLGYFADAITEEKQRGKLRRHLSLHKKQV